MVVRSEIRQMRQTHFISNGVSESVNFYSIVSLLRVARNGKSLQTTPRIKQSLRTLLYLIIATLSASLFISFFTFIAFSLAFIIITIIQVKLKLYISLPMFCQYGQTLRPLAE